MGGQYVCSVHADALQGRDIGLWVCMALHVLGYGLAELPLAFFSSFKR